MSVVVPPQLVAAAAERGCCGRDLAAGSAGVDPAGLHTRGMSDRGSPRHGETVVVLPVKRAGEAAVLKISFPH
ncbi:hypothetical protein SAMN05421854_104300 [Amycolatopsis rubida]|uniref:Uncharacterized protein n=1 Tax=Amycolatopsis rubida TaxID=112413 RepID=A0A1I5N9B7_9PSEU|nr:hypothetical protein SAMN05421854_104300 [Amycolatopsis rubida]